MIDKLCGICKEIDRLVYRESDELVNFEDLAEANFSESSFNDVEKVLGNLQSVSEWIIITNSTKEAVSTEVADASTTNQSLSTLLEFIKG